MHLYYSQTSPYSRKCRIALYVTGLVNQVEQTRVDPFADTDYRQINPFGKVPALITDGVALFDSPIICQYLDQQGQKINHTPPLFPSPHSDTYFFIQASHAQANGILDAAVASMMERRRSTEHSVYWLDRWQQSIKNAVTTFPIKHIGDAESVNIATIATAAALGYLDFRFGDFAWRQWNSELAQWFELVQRSSWMEATNPS